MYNVQLVIVEYGVWKMNGGNVKKNQHVNWESEIEKYSLSLFLLFLSIQVAGHLTSYLLEDCIRGFEMRV